MAVRESEMRLSEVYYRAKGGRLTASECVEVLGGSMKTQGEAHPPHPHAHIAKDGFTHELPNEYDEIKDRKDFLLSKINNKSSKKTTKMERQAWSKEHGKIVGKLQKIVDHTEESRFEGLHLDPDTMARHVQAKYRLGNQYHQRAQHSEFEDSETSVMALFYALRSPAGVAALYEIMHGWFFNASWTRVTIASKTAADGLASGLKAPAVAKGKKPSAHHLRGRPIQMVERGAGGAGAAPVPRVAIDRVVTVIDRIGSDDIRLVTHYPTNAWTLPHNARFGGAPFAGAVAAHDFVQWRKHHPYGSDWKAFPKAAPADLSW